VLNLQQISTAYNTVVKTVKILLAFQHHNEAMGTVELSQMLGFHRSTVSRILKVLVAYDFIQKDPNTKKFSLSSAIITLASSLKQSMKTELIQISKPYVDELRTKCKETVIIELPSGDGWIMAYIAISPRPFRLVAEVGERIPYHAAAGSKVYLAFSDPELKASLLKGKLDPITKYTITDRKQLDRKLEQIRQEGYTFDKQHLTEDVNAISVPIFDYRDKPVASIVVAGSPQRIKESNKSLFISELKETAKLISNQLGYKKDAREPDRGRSI
jgi:IclR family acetate operon transcriptional repressor